MPGGRRPRRRPAPKEPKIDWAGLKRRTRQVTRSGVGLQLHPGRRRQDARSSSAPKAAREAAGPAAGAVAPSIYTIQDDGKRLNRIASGTADRRPTPSDDAPPRASRRVRRRDLEPERSPATAGPSSTRRAIGLQRAVSAAAVAAGGGCGGGVGGGGPAAAGGSAAAPARRPPVAAAAAQEAGHLRRHRQDRQAQRVGGDVRRRLADDEVPLLRPQDARQGLGRHARQVQAAGRVRRRPPGADERHQRDDRRAERLAHRRLGRRRPRPRRGRRRRRRPATSASTSRPTTPRGRYKVAHVYEDGPGRQGLGQGRDGQLPDRHRRQARQGRRRLLRRSSAAGSTARSS